MYISMYHFIPPPSTVANIWWKLMKYLLNGQKDKTERRQFGEIVTLAKQSVIKYNGTEE